MDDENKSQFPLSAQWVDAAGNRTDVKIVTRATYELILNHTTTGTPEIIHIDRLDAPTMKVYPVPTGTADLGSIDLTTQTFAPDIAHIVGGNTPHGLAAAWQRWAILQTTSDIGAGAVRRLQQQDLRAFKADANAALDALLTFNSREHDDEDPISESSDCM